MKVTLSVNIKDVVVDSDSNTPVMRGITGDRISIMLHSAKPSEKAIAAGAKRGRFTVIVGADKARALLAGETVTIESDRITVVVDQPTEGKHLGKAFAEATLWDATAPTTAVGLNVPECLRSAGAAPAKPVSQT